MPNHQSSRKQKSGLTPATQETLLARSKGSSIYISSMHKRITDKVVSLNTNVSETQFTLLNDSGSVEYLLYSEFSSEEKGEWIFTKQMSLKSLFTKGVKPNIPPETITYAKQVFTLKRCYTLDSTTDDGVDAKKTVWDYFNEKHTENIAIETWFESGETTSEAFRGFVTSLDKITIPPKESIVRQDAGSALGATLSSIQRMDGNSIGTLIIFGLIALMFIPFDILLALLIPVITGGIGLTRYHAPAPAFVFLSWLIMGALFIFSGKNPDPLVIGTVAVVLSTLVPRLVIAQSPFIYPKAGALAWLGVFPILWIYSFILYFAFCPSPREFGDLMSAIELPVIIAVVSTLIDFTLEAVWPRSA